MASAKELRTAIVEGRAVFQAALHGAHEHWERKPAAGEGEDAWSPRQVAEHTIGAEIFFASNISQACGAPAVTGPEIDCATPAAASATYVRAAAIADNVLRHVTDGDLVKTRALRAGEMTVERMLEIIAYHARDHANQIRVAS
ncbi:MAG: DinB family protein [Dehalococcoidia bacterium]